MESGWRMKSGVANEGEGVGESRRHEDAVDLGGYEVTYARTLAGAESRQYEAVGKEPERKIRSTRSKEEAPEERGGW